MANLENSWADQMEAQDQTPAPATKKGWGAVPQATPSRIGEDFNLPGVAEPKKDSNADVRYSEDSSYERRGGYDDRRGGSGYDDRRGGYRGDRGGDRGGDRYGERGGDRYNDRGGGYGERERGYGGDRGFGDRNRGGYERHPRDYEDSRRESESRDSHSHSEHDYHRSEDRGEEDRRTDGERHSDRGYDDRRGGYDDRRGGYDDRRGGYDDRRGDDRRGGYERREPRPRVQHPVPDVAPFTAYVGNLPYQITEAEVAELFEPTPVTEVRLRKGYSYVEFNTREDLVEALNVAGKSVLGRDIRVDVAEPPKHREGGDRYERREAPSRGTGRWEDDGRDRWTRGSELPRHEPAPRRERDDSRDYREDRRPGPPRLDLKPRSEAAEAKSPETNRSSSIFGAAKPVDTAAVDRKREEERLQREEENRKRREEEKKRREEEAAAAPAKAEADKAEKPAAEKPERTERTEKPKQESPADSNWRRRDAQPARAWNKISEEQDRFDRGDRRGGRGGRGGASDRGGRRQDNRQDNRKPQQQAAPKKESNPTSQANAFSALAEAGDS